MLSDWWGLASVFRCQVSSVHSWKTSWLTLPALVSPASVSCAQGLCSIAPRLRLLQGPLRLRGTFLHGCCHTDSPSLSPGSETLVSRVRFRNWGWVCLFDRPEILCLSPSYRGGWDRGHLVLSISKEDMGSALKLEGFPRYGKRVQILSGQTTGAFLLQITGLMRLEDGLITATCGSGYLRSHEWHDGYMG